MDNLKTGKRERVLTFFRLVWQPYAMSFYLWYLIISFQWRSTMRFSYRIPERSKKARKMLGWEHRQLPILSQKLDFTTGKNGKLPSCFWTPKKKKTERKGIGSYILLWKTGINNCQTHLKFFVIAYVLLVCYISLKVLRFGRILKRYLFHLLMNWINPSISSQKDPLATLNIHTTGNFTLSPCHVSSPQWEELIFLHSLRGWKAFLWAKISLTTWSFCPRSHAKQHFSIYSKICFLHILTTIKSEEALQSCVIILIGSNFSQRQII